MLTPAPINNPRILAVKLADLGDLLMITPALQALRAAHPGARLDLLAPPSSAHLLRGAPFLDHILTFDKFPFDSLGGLLDPARVLATLGFIRALRKARYDVLVIFHHFTMLWGTLKFGVLSLASGAPVRAGLDNGRGRFLTLRARDDGFGARHEADYWLQVAALLGADPAAGWQPYLPISAADRSAASRLLSELQNRHDGPLVALHLGAGNYSPARIWPIERFAAVARALIDDGVGVVVLGGPEEEEKGVQLQELVGCKEKVLNLAGRTSIHESAAVLASCDLFLGNDSGPMHVAAAMGTPVVAVFGPSNAQAWGPYTPPGEPDIHTIVSMDLPCQPCFYRAHSLGLREGCGPRPCLTQLGHEHVLEACRRVLQRRYVSTA
jgi:heptosyltransferase-2